MEVLTIYVWPIFQGYGSEDIPAKYGQNYGTKNVPIQFRILEFPLTKQLKRSLEQGSRDWEKAGDAGDGTGIEDDPSHPL